MNRYLFLSSNFGNIFFNFIWSQIFHRFFIVNPTILLMLYEPNHMFHTKRGSFIIKVIFLIFITYIIKISFVKKKLSCRFKIKVHIFTLVMLCTSQIWWVIHIKYININTKYFGFSISIYQTIVVI